jgi:hypothetical protein
MAAFALGGPNVAANTPVVERGTREARGRCWESGPEPARASLLVDRAPASGRRPVLCPCSSRAGAPEPGSAIEVGPRTGGGELELKGRARRGWADGWYGWPRPTSGLNAGRRASPRPRPGRLAMERSARTAHRRALWAAERRARSCEWRGARPRAQTASSRPPPAGARPLEASPRGSARSRSSCHGLHSCSSGPRVPSLRGANTRPARRRRTPHMGWHHRRRSSAAGPSPSTRRPPAPRNRASCS